MLQPRSSSPALARQPLAVNGLDGYIDRQLGECRRFHEPLALLSIAIERIAGADGVVSALLQDAAMLEVGQRLRGRVRSTDHVLWAGEREFVVTLPATRLDGALTVQRRLAQHLSGAYRIEPELVIVSLRVGCACYPAAGASAAQLLAAAQVARDGPTGLRSVRR